MFILYLICIAILIFYVYCIHRKSKEDTKWYAARKQTFLEKEEQLLASIRKRDAKIFELESELEEAERKMNLLRQMNEKLRRGERGA